MLSIDAMSAAAIGIARALTLTEDERLVSYLSLAHTIDRLMEFVALTVGFEVYYIRSMRTFIEDVKSCRPTYLSFTPSVLQLVSRRQNSLETHVDGPDLSIIRYETRPLNSRIMSCQDISGLTAFGLQETVAQLSRKTYGTGSKVTWESS